MTDPAELPPADADARELALAALAAAPDRPLPAALCLSIRRVMDEPERLAQFRAALEAEVARPEPAGLVGRAADADALLDAVADEIAIERVNTRAAADRLIRALGTDPLALRRAVDRRREALLLGDADTLLLINGRVAPLRLERLGAALRDGVVHPLHQVGGAVRQAFRALLLPDLAPDGLLLAASSSGIPIYVIDPQAMGLRRIGSCDPRAVDSLTLAPVHNRRHGYRLSGEPGFHLDARDLPEGTFPGGVLMVVFPLHSGSARRRLSAGGMLQVEHDASTTLRFAAVIEESFDVAGDEPAPRLDRSGLKLVLVPQELCGPWREAR